jgi:arsenate reductase
MADKIFNVLFLCMGNSARSVLAEAIMKRVGQGRFNACSAGLSRRGRFIPTRSICCRN